MSVEPRVAIALAHLSMSLPGLPDLGDALQRIADTAAHLVPGCEGASITIRHPGDPFTVAATGPQILDLDEVQYTGGAGPCLDALDSGWIVPVADLSQEARWSAFTAAAVDASVHSTLSVPLLVGADVVGVLNHYGREPLTTQGRDVAHELATRCAGTVSLARLYLDSAALARKLQQAVSARAQVERAKGVLMAQHQADEPAAFGILATRARRSGQGIAEAAAAVLAEVRPPWS